MRELIRGHAKAASFRDEQVRPSAERKLSVRIVNKHWV